MFVKFTAAFAEAIRQDEFDLPGTTWNHCLPETDVTEAFLQTILQSNKYIGKGKNHEQHKISEYYPVDCTDILAVCSSWPDL